MSKRVLVLCTGNSCRSQMAEALFAELGRGQWKSASAGSAPSGYVHPLAIRVMADRGIDISHGRSKSIGDFEGQTFDLVVTVCDNAYESCPYFPGAREQLHWPFDDPAEATGSEAEQLPVFVRVRDEIEQQIAAWLESGEGMGESCGPRSEDS